MVRAETVAKILQSVLAERLADVRAKKRADIICLTAAKEGMEKTDVACLDRNYDALYAVADIFGCETPTACFCKNVFKELDVGLNESKLSHLCTKTSQAAWHQFEGEKLHAVFSFCNRHLTCKKRTEDRCQGR